MEIMYQITSTSILINDGIADIIEAGGVDTDNDGVVDGFADGGTADGWASTFDISDGGNALADDDKDGDGSQKSIRP